MGQAFYIGARLAEDGYISFYRSLAKGIDLPQAMLPKGVVKKTRNGSDGPVEFVFNYRKNEVTVDLGDSSFTRLSDKQTCSGKTCLKPYETLIRHYSSANQTSSSSQDKEPHILLS